MKIINGTSFHEETPNELISILEKIRLNKTRIVIDYGNPKTGESWNEVNDIKGTISRSCGNIKIPILLHNKRSISGCGIFDNCIIKISKSKGSKVLYSI